MRKIGHSLVLALLALIVVSGTVFGAAIVNSASALSSTDARIAETSLGDLIADAVRASQSADIAFVSASELKEIEIPRGKVSTDDIARAIAYPDDPIVVLDLTGDQIRKALEKSVSIYDQRNLGFLQISGLRFTFKKSSGNRIGTVTIGSDPIVPEKTYSVSMSNSMANGALGYWKIWTKEQIKRVSKQSYLEAIEGFLTGKTTLDYGSLIRITVNK